MQKNKTHKNSIEHSSKVNPTCNPNTTADKREPVLIFHGKTREINMGASLIHWIGLY